jgi:hypothetical protein
MIVLPRTAAIPARAKILAAALFYTSMPELVSS